MAHPSWMKKTGNGKSHPGRCSSDVPRSLALSKQIRDKLLRRPLLTPTPSRPPLPQSLLSQSIVPPRLAPLFTVSHTSALPCLGVSSPLALHVRGFQRHGHPPHPPASFSPVPRTPHSPPAGSPPPRGPRQRRRRWRRRQRGRCEGAAADAIPRRVQAAGDPGASTRLTRRHRGGAAVRG